MTKLLERAVEAVRQTSEETQDAVAELMLLTIAEDQAEPEDIPAEHREAVLEGLDQVERGEFATEEQVAAAWRRFDR